MTAYEEFSYGPSDEVIAVFPATPSSVWAERVFEFSETLRQEMARFEDEEEGDLGDGSLYTEGYYDAAEQLRNRFYEIFGVTETLAQ